MNKELNIIYEDDKMIICNKPAGILAQSNRSFDADMVSMVMAYRRKKGEEAYAAVINRLDCPVSGLMVFGKNKIHAAYLSKLLQNESLNKQYYAVICGKLQEDSGKFVDYLLKDGKNNTSQIVKEGTPGCKRAELEYEVLQTLNTESGITLNLVRIHLITGRHHQIRVQFSSRNLPLAGDRKYGGDAAVMALTDRNSQELALCAYSLEIGKNKFQIKPEGREFSRFELY